MGSLVRCLLRTCFEYSEHDAHDEYDPPRLPPLSQPPAASIRRLGSSGHRGHTSTGGGGGNGEDVLVQRHPDEDGSIGDDCHDIAAVSAGRTSPTASRRGSGGAASGLRAFFEKLGLRGPEELYDSLERTGGDTPPSTPPLSSSPRSSHLVPSIPGLSHATSRFGVIRRSNSSPPTKKVANGSSDIATAKSPLRTASSFEYDSSREVPSISLDEIVMPGSELQRQMADAMKKELEGHDDECVICMEGFSTENPRMPTLCGCGENKTFFHLPCLYQWIEQNRNCPSCRKRLRWEEF